MEKQKRTIEFFANNTDAALEIKQSLEEKDFEVNHIYTGSSVPIVFEMDKDGKICDCVTGAGKIRGYYQI